MRRIQRRGESRAHAKDENEIINWPNAKQLHPVINLSTLGSFVARSSSDAALRASNRLTPNRALRGPVAKSLSASRESETRNGATKRELRQQTSRFKLVPKLNPKLDHKICRQSVPAAVKNSPGDSSVPRLALATHTTFGGGLFTIPVSRPIRKNYR